MGSPRSQTARAKRSTSTSSSPSPHPPRRRRGPARRSRPAVPRWVLVSLPRRSRPLPPGTSTTGRTRSGTGTHLKSSCWMSPVRIRSTKRIACSSPVRSEPRTRPRPGSRAWLKPGTSSSASACSSPRAWRSPARARQASERLDPDEIAQHEHERIWKAAQTRSRGRVRRLPRLVVLDDPARAEGIEVDAVDLPGQREAVDLEAALELGAPTGRSRRRLLEPARDEREGRLGFLAHEVLEIAPEPLFELSPLQVAELDPNAAVDRLREAGGRRGRRRDDPRRRAAWCRAPSEAPRRT